MVCAMAKRLQKSEWIDFGLSQLAGSGPAVLRADPLCKALGVSRGSFYWHFENLEAFHLALLGAWEKRTADAMDTVAAFPVDQQLGGLMQIAGQDGQALETAIRAWAASSGPVADAVARIDQVRVDFLMAIFRALGMEEDTAIARARFIYAASLGRMVSRLPDPNIAPKHLAEIAALLTRA